MNILILANKDIASNYALNLLIPTLKEQHQVHLWLSAKVGNTNNQAEQLSQLKFFEQDSFNKISSRPLKTATSNKFIRFEGFEGLNHHLNSKIREENNINSAESITRIKKLCPDLIISIRYGGILKSDCIKIPHQGVINLHSGILPKYRGVMATFWAMLNDDAMIGTTLHTIKDGTIDSGDIIKVSRTGVNNKHSYLQQTLALYRQGTADIIEATLSYARNEKIVTYPQPNSDSYFTFPMKEDFVRFEQKGLILIDEQAHRCFLRDYYQTGD